MVRTKTAAPFDMYAGMNDREKILRYLAHNDHLTRMQAIHLFRIHNVTARLTELRQEGWRIATEIRFDTHGRRYARWRLNPIDARIIRLKVYSVQQVFSFKAATSPVGHPRHI